MNEWLWNGLGFAQTAPKSWTSIFYDLDPDNRFVVLIVMIGCLTGVICTIIGCASTTLDTMHRRRLEAEMKRDMIERGMSAEEIVTVIQATRPRGVS